MRPVLEEQPPAIDQPIEALAVVGAEPAPDGQVVGAIEDVDRVHLQAPDVFDEATQAPRRQPGRARPREVLALEEEGRDRAGREDGT